MPKTKKSILRQKVTSLKIVLSLGILVLLVKFSAYAITGSNAILSDALESLINIAASGFALFSVIYGARPRDENHPYGHGKMEAVAVGFEGALILLTGIFIIIKSIFSLLTRTGIREVDYGIYITAFSGVMLLGMSLFLESRGARLKSQVLIADGKHLMSDVLTSAALVAGLFLYKLTGLFWIDSVLAILLSSHIMFSGYGLLKKSLDELMDKADSKLLESMAQSLEKERKENWIDIHHLKAQKYGSHLHIDCHVTMPFYLTLEETHQEIKNLERAFNRSFDHRVELSVHTDPCMQQSCRLCHVGNCEFRKEPFEKHVEWTVQNLTANRKHTVETPQIL